MAEANDFLSFAKDIEKQQVKVNVWQNNGGSNISYQFRLLCRLETQHFMVFRLSGDYHDYEFNPRLDLNFKHGDKSFTIQPSTFIFDGRYIIVKYSTVKVSARDTKVDESESRRNTRFRIRKEYKAKIELSSLRLSEKVVGMLIDISQSGMAIKLPEKHAALMQLDDIININSIANERIEMLEARIVHKRLIDEEKKHYQLAVNFTTPLKMTKVLTLVKLCKKK